MCVPREIMLIKFLVTPITRTCHRRHQDPAGRCMSSSWAVAADGVHEWMTRIIHLAIYIYHRRTEFPIRSTAEEIHSLS